MSGFTTYMTYAIYFIGFLIVVYSIINDRKIGASGVCGDGYVNKKNCIWDSKTESILYTIDIIYNGEIFRIEDENLFDRIKEGSSVKVSLNKIKDVNGSYKTELKVI